MKKVFKWITGTVLFKGFALVTVLILTVVLFMAVLILIQCLFYSDFSTFQEVYKNIRVNSDKIIATWIVFSLLASYFIITE